MFASFVVIVLIGYGVFSSIHPSPKEKIHLESFRQPAPMVIGYKHKNGYELMNSQSVESITPKTFPVLRQEHPKQVLNKNCPFGGVIFIPFKVNSYLVDDTRENALYMEINRLEKCGYTNASIYGFASPDGDKDKNFILAKDRASFVQKILQQKFKELNIKTMNPMGGEEIKERKAIVVLTKGKKE